MPDDHEGHLEKLIASPPSGGRVDLSRLSDHQLADQIDDAIRERTYRVEEPARSAVGQLLLHLLAERSRRTRD